VKLNVSIGELIAGRIKELRRCLEDRKSGMWLVPVTGSEDEVAAHVGWFNDGKIRPYLMPNTFREREEISAWLLKCAVSSNDILWGIWIPSGENRLLVGHIHIDIDDGMASSEPWMVGLSYLVGSEYWNSGYATNAVAMVVEYLRMAGFKAIETTAYVGNAGSIRVLKNNGFREITSDLQSQIDRRSKDGEFRLPL
jgi:RimJ/RimL family protein N-acetyltransferase